MYTYMYISMYVGFRKCSLEVLGCMCLTEICVLRVQHVPALVFMQHLRQGFKICEYMCSSERVCEGEIYT